MTVLVILDGLLVREGRVDRAGVSAMRALRLSGHSIVGASEHFPSPDGADPTPEAVAFRRAIEAAGILPLLDATVWLPPADRVLGSTATQVGDAPGAETWAGIVDSWCIPWEGTCEPPRLALVRVLRGVRIWVVDGAVIRASLDPRWERSGHRWSHAYIPDDEAWLDSSLFSPARGTRAGAHEAVRVLVSRKHAKAGKPLAVAEAIGARVARRIHGTDRATIETALKAAVDDA